MEEVEEEETGVAAAGIKPDTVCIVYKLACTWLLSGLARSTRAVIML